MKVVLVEDEPVIRRGIIKKVQWDKFEISEVYEADNGETGYELIIREKPEIIILDICLPRMNGIELLTKIRESEIDSKVIILSGHDEFEYAQQAIKLGVDNYLLKPSTSREIEAILGKICVDINLNFEKKANYEEMKKKLQDMIPYFKSGLINSIITGDFNSEAEIINLSTYLNLNLKNVFYISVVLLIESSQVDNIKFEEALLDKVEIYQLVRQLVDDNAIIDSSTSDRIIIILSDHEDVDLKKKCFSTVNKIVDTISKQVSRPVVVGIGNVKKGIKGIRDSYKEALSALENRFIDAKNRVYFIEDTILGSHNLNSYPYDEEKKFLGFIKLGKIENATGSLNNLFDILKSKKDRYPIALIKIHLRQLTYYMVQIIYEVGGDISDLYCNTNILEYAEDFTRIDEYQLFLCKFTEKLCGYISNKRYLKHTTIIRRIITYIQHNYSCEDLNLERISEFVDMHPNYISHMFKKEIGESLSSYICKFRIEKAKELILNSDILKVSDIAYDVGFSDSHYFTTCFKNVLGITPSEYIQLNRK